MAHVRGDVRPELADDIGERVSPQDLSILNSERSDGPLLAGILSRRDTLGHSAAQQLRKIHCVVSVVVRRDQNSCIRVPLHTRDHR
jgi:hypothetical protein